VDSGREGLDVEPMRLGVVDPGLATGDGGNGPSSVSPSAAQVREVED
jgi:hypothetical protein